MANRPAASGRLSFSDINTSMSSYKAIQWAVSEGIIVGYPADNTFRPGNPVTRQQIAVMLWRWLGRPSATKNGSFSDVNSSMSSYKAIMWAQSIGIVKGSGGKFMPANNCTRSQIVTIFYRCVREGTLDAKINPSIVGTVK